VRAGVAAAAAGPWCCAARSAARVGSLLSLAAARATLASAALVGLLKACASCTNAVAARSRSSTCLRCLRAASSCCFRGLGRPTNVCSSQHQRCAGESSSRASTFARASAQEQQHAARLEGRTTSACGS
jgi:hypothetical protein